MLLKRYRDQRGQTNTGWLKSMHSFSFGHYQDPYHMGFSVLRVINEDRVIPGAGFGTHPHSNMEIISYVLKGQLAHKDSLGNGSTIKPGEIQIMSAGSGITHSEYNASQTEEVHFLQIWIMPNVRDGSPNYQQKYFAIEKEPNIFHLVVSSDGENGSLKIKQDACMWIGRFTADHETVFKPKPNRKYWLQMTQGIGKINDESMAAGDGLAIEAEESIFINTTTDAEIILFDLP